MSKYEMTFLLSEEADIESVKESLTSVSGKIVGEKGWGKRTLTYPIDKKTSASYYTWTFEIDNTRISELKKKLNYNDKLMRYLLLIV